MDQEALLETGKAWFKQQGWEPFPFQLQAWQHHLSGYSGLVNAPTGSGKTYSLAMPILLEFLRDHPTEYEREKNGLQAIWITPTPCGRCHGDPSSFRKRGRSAHISVFRLSSPADHMPSFDTSCRHGRSSLELRSSLVARVR